MSFERILKYYFMYEEDELIKESGKEYLESGELGVWDWRSEYFRRKGEV